MDEPWQRAFVAARRRWTKIRVGYLEFARHLEQVGAVEARPSHSDDVYVCCACALGRPEARQVLLKQHGKDLEAFVVHWMAPGDTVAALARLHHQLFDAAPPLVAGYSGRVSLASWLRVTALRQLMLGQLKSSHGSAHPRMTCRRDVTELCIWLDVLPRANTLESGSLLEVQRALAAAFEALPLRDQTLMRLHAGRGVSVGALSKAYQLPEMMVKQRLLQNREQLLSSMCDRAWPVGATRHSSRGGGDPLRPHGNAPLHHSSVQRSRCDGDSVSSSTRCNMDF